MERRAENRLMLRGGKFGGDKGRKGVNGRMNEREKERERERERVFDRLDRETKNVSMEPAKERLKWPKKAGKN